MNEVNGFIKKELAPLNMSEAESKFNQSFEIISQERCNQLFFNSVVEGDQNLTKEDITRAELHPIAEIDLGKVKIGISKRFDGYGDYESALGYVEKDGQTLLCTFYKSRSANCWRYLPGYIQEEGRVIFSKGHEGEDMENSLNLPAELQKSLTEFYLSNPQLTTEPGQNQFLDENKSRIFLGTTKDVGKEKNSTRYFAEVQKISEQFWTESARKSRVSGEITDGKKALQDPKLLIMIGDENPAFSKAISSWEDPSSKYVIFQPNSLMPTVEPIIYRVYLSKDKKFTYTFATTKISGKSFISSIEYTDSDYTSFGTKKDFFFSGDLTTPAQEYYSQTHVKGTNFEDSYGTDQPGNSYKDLSQKYLSRIKMIQDFENSIGR